ncbi:MAG: precorrin-6A reductase [Atribacterota bacterium]
MILILGGTTEGRVFAQMLHERGYPVWLSVAYEFGLNFVPNGIPAQVGPFSPERLRSFIQEKKVQVVVDTTHPFAETIKHVAREVALELGVPYLLYQRPQVELPPFVIQVKNPAEALQALVPYQRIFLTIGSTHLAPFVRLKEEGKKIRVRVLPVSRSLKRCEELGLTPKEVVAILGPVSTELNRVLFQEFGAEVVVSKESGREGGLLQKIEAAESLGIAFILVRHAQKIKENVFHGFDTLLERLGELYGS